MTAGAVILHGSGVANGQTSARAYGSAGVRALAAWPVSDSVSVEVTGDLEVPFVRVGARLGDAVVWRAAPVHGGLSVGVGWRL